MVKVIKKFIINIIFISFSFNLLATTPLCFNPAIKSNLVENTHQLTKSIGLEIEKAMQNYGSSLKCFISFGIILNLDYVIISNVLQKLTVKFKKLNKTYYETINQKIYEKILFIKKYKYKYKTGTNISSKYKKKYRYLIGIADFKEDITSLNINGIYLYKGKTAFVL